MCQQVNPVTCLESQHASPRAVNRSQKVSLNNIVMLAELLPMAKGSFGIQMAHYKRSSQMQAHMLW